MKTALLLTVMYSMYCEGVVLIKSDITAVNERPIIGVLAQEKFENDKIYRTSYIAASYVKALESSGARVVPIMIGKDPSYYEGIMSKINGVLFPGGGTYFNQSNGYADAGQDIYDIAMSLNDAGDHFPVFGTCLGFELLIILASGRGNKENRTPCTSHKNMPLNFTKNVNTSKMFKYVPQDVFDLLVNEKVTFNNHDFCVVKKNLKSHNLTKDWRVTSYSNDDHGKEFISSIEHKRYPLFGVQFHPEKSAFEWSLSANYPHSVKALKANRYFMDFFVGECRKNFHSFEDTAEENRYLIYNFPPVFTGALGETFQQIYTFKKPKHHAVSSNVPKRGGMKKAH